MKKKIISITTCTMDLTNKEEGCAWTIAGEGKVGTMNSMRTKANLSRSWKFTIPKSSLLFHAVMASDARRCMSTINLQIISNLLERLFKLELCEIDAAISRLLTSMH